MAFIFDIKRYAIHDGPGIRTTVFVKGCPLRCVWCHNPESWSPLPQRLYKENKCIGCATCVEVCPRKGLSLTEEGVRFDRSRDCLLCGTCADNCPALALEICGKERDIDSLFDELEKERGVMEHGEGGVTISGGEPLMHPDFTVSFLKKAGRLGFHRAVDTTLFASPEIVKEVCGECELFLVDLKCMDSEKHRLYTGVPNEPILHNLEYIASQNHPYYIRIPLIREVNADAGNIEATIRFLSGLERAPEVIDLLPYHDIGKGKHERMGTVYNPDRFSLSPPTEEETNRSLSAFISAGFEARTGG